MLEETQVNKVEHTHYLQCSHCVGRNRNIYYMKCNILKRLPNGKLKLEVFGQRDWKNKEHIKQTRYTEANRVHKKEKFIIDQKEMEL
jgi:hypothetical protein